MGVSILEWASGIEPPSDIYEMATLPLTPSKRPWGPDADLTPTKPVSEYSEVSHGDSQSDIVSTASSSRRSPTKRSVSPKKREIALRMARAFPIHREDISSVQNPTSLMQELAKVRGMSLIPVWMKDQITRDSGWANPPHNNWFYDDFVPGAGPLAQKSLSISANHTKEDHAYIYRRIKKIRDNTIERNERMDYEASWNEAIHWPLLELALDNVACAGVCCRNVTQCGVYKELRDPDPLLADTKSDYVLCLDPPDKSRLAELLRHFRQRNPQTNRAAHVQFSDEASTPPVVGIETKSSDGDGATQSGAQSASFVRGQFRHLSSLPRAEHKPLPIIPTILIHGARWSVDFAHRTESQTVSRKQFILYLLG
ncbi:hypothetical protein MAJ_03380, partial [Metarhizium majus ARSEF 297]